MTLIEQLALLHVGWRDVVEVALVAFVLYRLLLLFQGTRTVQMVTGVAVLIIAYAVSWWMKLTMITYLLGIVFTYGAFALLVIFQPELRAALAHLGRSRVTRLLRSMGAGEIAEQISEAAERLAQSGIGAIIALERDTPLADYVESGTALQAKVSADLLTTIFTPYSPLHDGAVIVREDTIVGAGCILPLSPTPLADRSLGTRHRAALGLSEETDAMVIIVSEESSTISVAVQGRLTRGLSGLQLRDMIAGRAPRRTADQPLVEVTG
jgi:diadenylate cyclase